jgi:TPR repeat protein
MKRHLPALIALSFITLPLIADSGTDAYKNGDYATALKEWQSAADDGVEEAEYNLGLLYARGLGVLQDFAKAAQYYREAAEQGNVDAEYNLAVLYSQGKGVPKDTNEAIKLFRQAADASDVNAAHSLGDLYYDNKQYEDAREWYEIAAEGGVADAEFGIGLMYDLGQGLPVDYDRALKYYQQAAEQGSASALVNMAVLYYNGQGVPVDREIAHRYFLIASRMGEERAKNLIKLTTEKLKPEDIEKAEQESEVWIAAHPAKYEPAPEPMNVFPPKSRKKKHAKSVAITTTSSFETPRTD